MKNREIVTIIIIHIVFMLLLMLNSSSWIFLFRETPKRKIEFFFAVETLASETYFLAIGLKIANITKKED